MTKERKLPRQNTIGGSSVAAILGYSPFATQHDVWSKFIYGSSAVETDAMRRGTRLEPIVCDVARDWLAQNENLSIRVPWNENEGIVHPTLTMFHGTVDCLVYSGDRLVGIGELKTTTARKRWNDDRADYNLQGQHYLWVYNDYLASKGLLPDGKPLENWWLICLQADEEVFSLIETYDQALDAIEKGSARLFCSHKTIDRNYAKNVIPALVSWWDDYVVAGVAPPVDGSEGCTKSLRLIHQNRDGQMEATEAIIDAARRRDDAHKEIKRLEVVKRKAENELRSMLGSSKTATANGVRITISNQTGRMKFDQTSFIQDHPELYKKYLSKGSDFDQLRISIKDTSEKKER